MIVNWTRQAVRFFSWWAKELFAVLPSAWQRRLRTPANALLLRVVSTGVHMVWINADSERDLGIFSADAFGQEAWQKQLAAEKVLATAKRILVLAPKQYLDRQVYLPAAAISNLRQVMGFEIDRHTPFQAQQAFYDVKCLDDGPVNDHSIRVRVVTSPIAQIEPMLNSLQTLGISPGCISFSDSLTWPLVGEAYNLLPISLRPATNKRGALIGAALGLLLLVQALVLLSYPTWHAKQKVEQLNAEMEALHIEVQSASEMLAQVDELLAQAISLRKKTQDKPYVVDLIRELTIRLPDNTWLNQLRFTGNRIEIQGYSDKATSLIQRMDDSVWFENPRFISPIMTNKVSKQAFKIGLDLEKGGRHAAPTND